MSGRHSKGGRKAGTGGLTMLGESPCDKCLRGSDYCKKNRLACNDYLHYMKKGTIIKRNRAPTADCYLRIQANGKTKNEQQIRTGKEKGRAKEEIRTQEGTSQKARIKEYLRKNKKKVTQILIDGSGILTLIEKEINAETQSTHHQIIIIT